MKKTFGDRLLAVLASAILGAASLQCGSLVSAASDDRTDALLEIYEQNQFQDAKRFRRVHQLAQASPSLDMVIHNPRFADYETRSCIDVSKFQGDIDWNLVAEDGVEQAIIRIGLRGYSNGALVADPKHMENLEGASAAGLDTGVYFFSQAISTEEAIEEADFVLNLLKGYGLTMPVYMDVEEVPYDVARLDQARLSQMEQTEICGAFCSTIEAGGYHAGIYASKSVLNNKMYADELSAKYSIWLANYEIETNYQGDYQIWQYSENGCVNGISSPVDMDVSYSRRVDYAASSLRIQKGQSLSPVLFGDSILSYWSTNPEVAVVDRNGRISAVGVGTASITAISSNGTSDTIEISVCTESRLACNYSEMVYENVVNPLPGDSNFDGWINASDAGQVLMYAANAGSGSQDVPQLDELQWISFDFNQDGFVNASDASCVLILSAQTGASAA